MILYLDTSAWFRLYVDEPKRDEVLFAVKRSVANATHLIAYVELQAALARAIRMGRIDPAEGGRICRQVESDWADMLLVRVDEPLVHRAGALARQYELRGYDSVHLAAAERLSAESRDLSVLFVCFDEALCQAATHLGIKLLDM